MGTGTIHCRLIATNGPRYVQFIYAQTLKCSSTVVSVGFTSYCPIALVQTIATVSTMMMALVPHAMTFWNLVFR
jgi:hypothetical protein